MSCKVWDRSQTPRILMSGSREPGSGRRNVYFWQQCPVPPCQGVRDPGSRDQPAHHSLLHKVEAEICAFPTGSLGPLDTPSLNPACPELSDNVSVCRVGGWVAWALSAASLHLWEPGTTLRAFLKSQGPEESPHFQTSGLLGSPLQHIKGNLRVHEIGSKVR